VPADARVSIGFGFGGYGPYYGYGGYPGYYDGYCDPRSRWYDPYRCDDYDDYDYYDGPVFIDGFWFNGPFRSRFFYSIKITILVSVAATQLSNTWWFTMLQQHVPEHARSRVSSYDWLVSLIFQPMGSLLAGPLALSIGFPATLIGAAGIGLAGNFGVLTVRDVREVRWVEEPPA